MVKPFASRHVFVFANRCDDHTALLGLVIKFKCVILHQGIKFSKILVNRDLLYNIMYNWQRVLFTFDVFVERI